MATHSSILAWRIPWTKDPGGGGGGGLAGRGWGWWSTVHEIAESDKTQQLSMEEELSKRTIRDLKLEVDMNNIKIKEVGKFH